MARSEVSGLLVVDKPRGPTSHDVVAKARRRLGTRRVGHTGTLDPFATGVLVLAVGEALKLAAHVTDADKIYEADLLLGRETDSLDDTGATLAEAPVPELGSLEHPAPLLLAALHAERERRQQVPPALSAIRQNGERAYDRVRRGEEVVLPPRPVQVHSLELLAVEPSRLRLRVHAAKGYYVRALARDLATGLGGLGHLCALRRVQSGVFGIDEAQAIETAPLLPLDQVLPRVFARITAHDPQVVDALHHGRRVPPGAFQEPVPPGLFAIVDTRGAPLVLAELDAGLVAIRRGFR